MIFLIFFGLVSIKIPTLKHGACVALSRRQRGLQYHSVKQKMVTQENSSADKHEQVVFEDYSAFNWANFTLDKMESLNNAICARLIKKGCNRSELQGKVNR